MAAPHGTHGEGAAAGAPATADARQIRSLELESAVEDLRARVLELGASEAIPEKAATEVAGALPAMLEDAALLNMSVNSVAFLAAAFAGDDSAGLYSRWRTRHGDRGSTPRRTEKL